jgi:uncharacterized protein (TIGR00661 family)
MKILYGVTGEGLGHAMRSRVVIEHLLAAGHEIQIMASGKACEFLGKRFEGVNRISGLHMILEENRVRLGKTLWSNIINGVAGLPKNIGAYFDLISQFRPEMVISDFESWAYLYGKTHDVPVLSVDNMQIIHRTKLPAEIISDNRVAFELTKAFIKTKLPFCDAYFITTFFQPEVRKPDTRLFPPILRPEILQAKRSTGDHLLVYQSGTGQDALHAALRANGVPCRVYGASQTAGKTVDVSDGNLLFRPFSESTFIADLASCRGVVAGGGFTLMGEAVFLHKPMLAVPLAGQFEQFLNARYLEREGFGMFAESFDDPATVQAFVSKTPTLARNLERYTQTDNRLILDAIDEFLRTVPRARSSGSSL